MFCIAVICQVVFFIYIIIQPNQTYISPDQLRQIWNLSDIDRDGYLDHHEYVVAMFLCDAVIQKGRPIPAELPMSVIPPSKRSMIKKNAGVF